MPEAEQVDVTIDENDLRIDVFRSSGPGGQSVNTTDSAVRITHLPTGIVVSCQNEKSQLQNKEQAMRILRARLLAAAEEAANAEACDARRSQVRTVDRSERIRTYNYPENRISDHRTGYKAYNLDQVLDGALEPVIESCVAGRPRRPARRARRLTVTETRATLLADGDRDAGRRRGGQPGATTPRCCSRTCSGTPRRAGARRRGPRRPARRVRARSSSAGPRGSRCST